MKLEFVQILKEDKSNHEAIKKLWTQFITELNENREKNTNEVDMIKGLELRIGIQGIREDMHFEICYLNDIPIGFSNYAVDIGGIKGVIDPGYGFIMGFYIHKNYRRQGIGKEMVYHIKNTLKNHNVKNIYTCPSPIIGEEFWKAMGFKDSNKIDPDDKLPIYISEIE